jgi:hypothetical protein
MARPVLGLFRLVPRRLRCPDDRYDCANLLSRHVAEVRRQLQVRPVRWGSGFALCARRLGPPDSHRVRKAACYLLSSNCLVGTCCSHRKPAYPGRECMGMMPGSPLGCTEAIMLAHGFTTDLLVDLEHEGLATATPETVHAGKRSMLCGCGSPMPDGWRWRDDGRWACKAEGHPPPGPASGASAGLPAALPR